MSLTLTSLAAPEAAACAPFVFPAYRAWLSAADSAGPVRVICAFLAGQMVGVIVGRDAGAGQRRANIVSLFVSPPHRNQGIGAALLAAMEAALRTADNADVWLEYTGGQATTRVFEHLLQKQQWHAPHPWARLFTIVGDTIAQARWLHYPLPAGFSAFPWPTLTTAEREQLQSSQTAQPWCPPDLWPFNPEEPLIDPVTSLGLRYQGAVVGWMLTHRVAPNTVRYTSLFVRPEARARRPAMPLLGAAIRAQCAQHTAENPEVGLFLVKSENEMMNRIADKRLSPYCQSIHHIYSAHKPLKPEAAHDH